MAFTVGREPAGRFPNYDPAATACALQLIRSYVLLMPLLEDLFRRQGLSTASFNVLMILRGAQQPLPPGVIGQRLLVRPATVTGVLDTLDKRGFIRRQPHPHDRRMALVAVTPEGLAAVEAVLPAVYAREAEAFGVLEPDEKATFIDLLAKLQTRLDQLGARTPHAEESELHA